MGFNIALTICCDDWRERLRIYCLSLSPDGLDLTTVRDCYGVFTLSHKIAGPSSPKKEARML